MSPRVQTYVAAGAVIAILAVVVVAGMVSRSTPSPSAAEIVRLDDAVALGKLDQEVLDQLRSSGEATAIVHLDTALILDGLRRALGEERADELIAGMSAAFATNKDLIRDALGPSADVTRDFEHLGAFVVSFKAEEPLLAVLRTGLVREVDGDRREEPTIVRRGGTQAARATLGLLDPQGEGVFVGVLDTGVDVVSHPQYFPAGSVVQTLESAPEDGAPDDHGHGTHVSSTVLLMAPQAKLYVADVFHLQERRPGSGVMAILASHSNVLAGMDWLIGLRQGGVNLRAVNLSLGSGHHPPSICADRFHLAEAWAAGIIPVGAAGNSAFEDEEGLPTTTYQSGIGSTGCDPNVLSVGAVSNGSCGDGRFDTIAEFSQSSEALDLLAPGECIVAAGGALSGTSMAAPHVTGAVAVLASASEVTSPEIWTALVTSGPSIIDPNSGIARRRLDIPAAITTLLGSAGPLPTPQIAPTRGVAVSDPEIAPTRDLEPGERYTLDSFLVRNTGSVAATYRLEVGDPALLLAEPAPAGWIAVSPGSLTLEPDELGFVFTDLDIPADAEPGDYAALITPIDDAAPASESGRSVLLTFTVGGPGSGGSGGSGGVGSGRGSTGDELAWLENPAILIVGGLIVLWFLWRLSRGRKSTS